MNMFDDLFGIRTEENNEDYREMKNLERKILSDWEKKMSCLS